jgi:hypothetical protein
MCNIWWPTFGNAESSLFVSLSLSLSAQSLNTESIAKDVLCHICVHTLGYQLGPKGLVGSRTAFVQKMWHLRHEVTRSRFYTRGNYEKNSKYAMEGENRINSITELGNGR